MYTRNITWQNKGGFFLFGPRGTGKTTWVRTEFPDAEMIDLLDDSLFTLLAAHPNRLEAILAPKLPKWVVIDEVQKIPVLLDEVHRLIESRKFRFVLTGSSARKLRRAGANLLAGRAITRSMHPLCATELAGEFDLAKSIRIGHLPAAYTAEKPHDYLRSYVATYLREEVQQEGLVRNLTTFSRFLEAASFSQAAILNIQRIADDCGAERKTVEGYFQVLEDLLIGVRLPPFLRRAKRKAIHHPKFYFFDAGVFRALRPRGPLDSESEVDGAALETLVLENARAINANLDLGYEFFHWRTRAQVEVDLVLYGARGFWAIEIKRTSRFHDSDLRGLKQFREDYPEATGLFLYLGDRDYDFEGIKVRNTAATLPVLGRILSDGGAFFQQQLEDRR